MIPGFTLTPETLTELARGGAGPSALASLAAVERSKNMLLLREVVVRSAALGHPGAQDAAAGYRLLARIQHVCPTAAHQVLRYPLIGTWASATLGALLRGDDGAAPQRLAAVAASAVLLAGAPIRVTFRSEPEAVVLPGVGQLVVPGMAGGEAVVLAPPYLMMGEERITLPQRPRSDAGAWQGVREVGLLLDDVDAWRFPGPIAPLPRLGAAEAAAWGERIAEARAVLADRHAAVAREVTAMTSVVVPITPPAAGTRSATSRTAYGSVALSWPHDATSAAVTLTHEVQHAKLAALMDLFDLVRPGAGGRFYAPWRDDPRPAAALLQGAYAHMGVAGFWRAERHVAGDPDVAHAEFVRWRDAAREASVTLLGSGTVTALGRGFVEGMLDTLARWQSDRVPAEASEVAHQAARSHRLQWSLRHEG